MSAFVAIVAYIFLCGAVLTDAQTIPSMSWERVIGQTVTPRSGSVVTTNETHAIVTGGDVVSGPSPPMTTFSIASRKVGEDPASMSGSAYLNLTATSLVVIPDSSTLPYAAVTMYGRSQTTGADVNTVYGLLRTTGRWVVIPTTGTVPTARSLAAGVYLTNCQNTGWPCLMWQAGFSKTLGTVIAGVVWVLWIHEATPRWQLPPTTGTGASYRNSHAIAATASGDKWVLFGGNDVVGQGLSGDTFIFATDGFSDPTVAESVNLASGKTATQSSTLEALGAASKGVDNALDTTYANGKCTQTNSQLDPWWSVDLGSIQRFQIIQIYWRGDVTDRNRGFKIYAGNLSTSARANPEVITPYTDSMYNPMIIRLETTARYVWVLLPGSSRILTVCEVQVYQRTAWRWRRLSGTTNVALLKPSIQSSNGAGLYDYGIPANANNGLLTDTTRTQDNLFASYVPTPDVYWRVDMQSVVDVKQINVYDGSATADRAANVEVYIGYNGDWRYNTKCWGPGSIYLKAPISLTSCAGRGRYVHVRKVPSTCTSCSNAGAYENQLMLAEVQVMAEAMLDQPSPRYGMGVTSYGKYMVIFGGTDTFGYRLNDVRFLDTVSLQWLAPTSPIGTPPAARAYPIFTTIPPGFVGAFTYGAPITPGSSILLLGGSGAVDTLGDIALLNMKSCPQFTGDGVATLSCVAGGTRCYYTCIANFVDTNAAIGNAGFVTCGPDGVWDGIIPVCAPYGSLLPGRPVVSSAILNADNSVTVNWSPGASGYGGSVGGFRVAAEPHDWSQYFPGNSDMSDWSLFAGPFNATRTNSYSISPSGYLAIQSAAGTDFAQLTQNGAILHRPFPTVTGLSVCSSSWSLEAFVRYDPMSVQSAQDGQFIGIGLVDISKNITFTGSVVPATQTGPSLELFAGLRKNLGILQPGWRSLGNVNYAVWYDSPIDLQFPVMGGTPYLYTRIDRDFPNRRFRSAFRYRPTDVWTTMAWRSDALALRGINTTTATGTWCPNPAAMRLAVVARSNPATRGAYGEVEYVRWGPLACATQGSVIDVGSANRSATISGLTAGRTYTFRVAQTGSYGWGSYSLSSSPVVIPPPSMILPYDPATLLNVSVGKPCFQSSTANIGTAPNNRAAVCNTANDGTVSVPSWMLPTLQSFSQTLATDMSGASWTVDLGFPTHVRELIIDNVNTAGSVNLDDFEVIVGNTARWQEGEMCDPAFVPQNISANDLFTRRFPCRSSSGAFGLVGRYVTIHIGAGRGLLLREVSVLAGNNCSRARESTGGTQIGGTNCAAGAPYGAVCVHECPANYVRTGGVASSTCNGVAWNYPELVCEPVCPDLPPPTFAQSCSQTLYNENFDTNVNGTLGSAWTSLDGTSQALKSSVWFLTNNALQLSAGTECGGEFYSVLSGAQYYNYRGAFTWISNIRSSGRAGLVFRVQDRNNLYRYSFDARYGYHALFRLIDGVEKLITDNNVPYISGDVYHLIAVSSQTDGEITIYMDGRQVLYTVDGTFLSGTVGLYASTDAQFDDTVLRGDCTSCSGATNQATCTFTCNSGLVTQGPATRTCVADGGFGSVAWFPSTITDTLACTLNPPTFSDDARSIVENSVKNTPVGDPLAASIDSPDYSLQFAITSGNVGSTFYVDSCSGQVKVLTPIVNYESIKQYSLVMKAFVPGFVGAESYANLTINVLDVNESPVVENTVFTVPENSAAETIVGTVRVWDPENDTLAFTFDTDGSAGAIRLNASTGEFTVSKSAVDVLDFELPRAGNPLALAVRATEVRRLSAVAGLGAQTTLLASTGTSIITISDANDNPTIPARQQLTLLEADAKIAVLPYAFASVASYDQDTGAFSSTTTFSLCPHGPSPTVTGLPGGAAMFDVSTSSPATVSLLALPTPNFLTMPAFATTDQDLARALYTVCIQATDTFGGLTFQNITIKVSADVPAQPLVNLVDTAPTILSTAGGETIVLNGTAFVSSYRYELRLSDATGTSGGVNQLISPCTTTIGGGASQLICTTVPGSGAGLLLSLYVDRGFGWELVPWRASVTNIDYVMFTITSVTGFSNAPTTGGQVVSFIGTSFGPQNQSQALLPSVTFGPGFTAICSTRSPASTIAAQTMIQCTLPAGAGAALAWRVTIAGRTLSSSDGSDAFVFSYAPPTVYSILPASSAFNLTGLDTAGKQDVVITGTNFGPLTNTIVSVTYTSPSLVTIFTMSCKRRSGVNEHTTLDCTTAPGFGANLVITVIIEGQTSGAVPLAGQLTYFSPVIIASAGVAFNAITGPGSSNAPTAGGSVVRIEGTGFGPVGHADINFVSYGRTRDDTVNRYTAVNCQVVQAPPQSGIISCQLAPGIGAGHSWMLSIGNQVSNVYAANTSYAPPRIADFSGAGSDDADTVGQQLVTIAGSNFGPIDTYSAGLLSVSYGNRLDNGPVSNISFVNISCAVTTAHVEISCMSAEGAGKALAWKVILDSLESAQPTTAYAAPLITGITLLSKTASQVVQVANVDGGDTAVITGKYFGPPKYATTSASLVQAVRYGPSGTEYLVPRSLWTAVSHTEIRATLLPGVGTNLRFTIAVADQVSSPTGSVTFDYATPTIDIVTPATADTYSDPRKPITLIASCSNLPLRDPQSRVSFILGNGAYARTLRANVPGGEESIAAATDALTGKVSVTLYLPQDGGGLDVGLQAIISSSDAGATATGSSASIKATSPVFLFQYNDPVISEVIITRARFFDNSSGTSIASSTNLDEIPCPFPAGDAVWSCTSGNVYQITLLGSNFAWSGARDDGITRILEILLINETFTGEVWSDSGVQVYSWDHTRIVAFATRTRAVLRLRIRSTAFDGTTREQQLVRSFFQASPEVSALRGAVTDIPTIGGSNSSLEFEVDVFNLVTGGSAEVYVGGRLATINYAPYTSLQLFINDKVATTPSGTPITLYVIPPPGQGKSVSVQVIRISGSNEREGSNTGFVVSYASPQVDTIDTIDITTSTVIDTLYIVPGGGWWYQVVTVPTDASAKVRFNGANMGTSPTVLIGDGYTLSFADGTLIACPGTVGTHTCFEGIAPAGEGTGYIFDEYSSSGYQALLSAGNQDGPSVSFRYANPEVTSITSATNSFPTTGNVTISIHGKNFGQRRGGRPDTVIEISFGTYMDSGGFADCKDIVRVSHYLMTCTLPEGAGADLTANLVVAGVYSQYAWWGSSNVYKFAYNRPNITDVYVTSGFGSSGTWPLVSGNRFAAIKANTAGGDTVVLTGTDFGFASNLNCVFLSWLYRSDDVVRNVPHICNQLEDFLGEGEVDNMMYVTSWSHTRIEFTIPAGLGAKEVLLSIRGQTLGYSRTDRATLLLQYALPSIDSLQPKVLNTEGGEVLVLTGSNFGPTPRNTTNPANRLTSEIFSPALPLSEAPGLPTAFIVVVAHRVCLTDARDISGFRPTTSFTSAFGSSDRTLNLDGCFDQILAHDHTSLTIVSQAGVGVNRSLTLFVVEAGLPGRGTAGAASSYSYEPPTITRFSPSVVAVSASRDPLTVVATMSFDIFGRSFGNSDLADIQGWSIPEREVTATVGGIPCVAKNRREEGENIVNCKAPARRVETGRRNVTVGIAGQVGFKDVVPAFESLVVVCAPGSYGRVGEVCLTCPAYSDDPTKRGAECPGYCGYDCLPFSSAAGDFESRFKYPVPLKGWYNLNSSDVYSNGESMMSACPEGFQDNGRDVCIVPCDPSDSCLGDNHCAYGYTSKAPNWRCASCDKGFYKRAGECIKCPDSPAGLFIGFAFLVVVVASVGFMLNKKQVNIAIISIGVDFFQVLAIFSQSRIKWPPVVKELLHVLSAFNLNIEIVAPECLIPDVSYKQKFYFIMLLPLCVGGLLGVMFLALALNKAVIKGREKKRWFTHKPTLVSSILVLLYMLYLYLTRTIFDVFNCAPTSPSDGYTYLQVVFERCGVAGGTQQTLLPFAIAALVVYTAGYPVFLGYVLYKNREIVMMDQLLRAKGLGNDRLSNPHAYQFRKMFGRSYFQFKPDYCMWIVVIILRKFFIAITAVTFNKNASFQMAACLLIMFIAYSLQMMFQVYLSPGDYDQVLASHNESAYTSAIHARLKAAIATIETRGRKKTRRNLLNFEGTIDRRAVLGVLSSWLFNYNTVEQLMLFAAVIVCLMGIMYQANEVNSYYPESKDSVTAVVLAVIILAIIYFFTVLITEVVILYNEDASLKAAAKAARNSSSAGGIEKKGSGRPKSLNSLSSSGGGTSTGGVAGRLVGEDGEINTRKVDTQMNPLFMTAGKSGDVGRIARTTNIGLEAILAQRTAPPTELWLVIQQSIVDVHKQLDDSNAALVEAKKQLQFMESGNGKNGNGGENEGTGVNRDVSRNKRAFAPRTTESSASSSSGSINSVISSPSQGNPLSGLRSLRTSSKK